MVMSDASPVVPRTHNPSVLACTWYCKIDFREGTSMSPFGRKGVTRAQIDPGVSGFISFLFDTSA
jgi:hypothetical protein